jgi:hypothetical protein
METKRSPIELESTDNRDGCIAPAGTESPKRAAPRADRVSALTELDGILSIEFQDGFSSELSLNRIGIDKSVVRIGTARVLENGTAIEYIDTEGDPYLVDGETLRYLADSRYAKEADARIKKLHIPTEKLDEYIAKRHSV